MLFGLKQPFQSGRQASRYGLMPGSSHIQAVAAGGLVVAKITSRARSVPEPCHKERMAAKQVEILKETSPDRALKGFSGGEIFVTLTFE
jgi:hypothetical protein